MCFGWRVIESLFTLFRSEGSSHRSHALGRSTTPPDLCQSSLLYAWIWPLRTKEFIQRNRRTLSGKNSVSSFPLVFSDISVFCLTCHSQLMFYSCRALFKLSLLGAFTVTVALFSWLFWVMSVDVMCATSYTPRRKVLCKELCSYAIISHRELFWHIDPNWTFVFYGGKFAQARNTFIKCKNLVCFSHEKMACNV